jgi:hypothetical protein
MIQYDQYQEFIIKMWGKLLYLDWETLPTEGNMIKSKLLQHIIYYNNLDPAENAYEIKEFEEWVPEGMSVNKRPTLTLQLFNNIMNSCQTSLENKIEVYRYSDNYILKPHKWISLTTIKDSSPYFGKKSTYILEPGTLVIFTKGLADKNEIIINTDELIKKYKNKKENI